MFSLNYFAQIWYAKRFDTQLIIRVKISCDPRLSHNRSVTHRGETDDNRAIDA